MRKLNILQMCSIKRRGGSGASASALVKKLFQKGHKVVYVCNGTSLGYDYLSSMGVQIVTSISMKARLKPTLKFLRGYWQDIIKTKELIEKEKIDILHVHTSPEHWIGAIASSLSGHSVALIRTRHIVVPVKNNYLNRYLFTKKTDKIITVAETIKKNYFNNGRYDSSKIFTIHDGIDIERFKPIDRGMKIREEFGIAPDAYLIGKIARFAKVKGHEYFFKAMSIVSKEFPNVMALLVGSGGVKSHAEEMERIKRLVRECGLDKIVLFAGFRKDIPEILSSIDLFVLSSIGSEGSSRGTLEAMAMGKPVVATRVGVLPELVEEGVTGYVVPPKDPDPMAGAIIKMIKDREKAREMGRRGREIVLKNFTEDIMLEKTEKLYYEALNGKQII